jgi:hypothetical protein
MDADSGLPVLKGPVDHLQYGFLNLETAKMAPHPIQGLEKRAFVSEFNNKLDRVKRSYGIHMAMRLASEEAIFGKDRRLPGLPSSRALYDTATGKATKIEFKDFLDNPNTRATGPPVSFHRQTEIQYGII